MRQRFFRRGAAAEEKERCATDRQDAQRTLEAAMALEEARDGQPFTAIDQVWAAKGAALSRAFELEGA